MIIYKITNLVNNKIYIGQTTKTREQRWRKHQQEAKSELKNKRPHNYFHSALLKYGAENFKCEIIDQADSIEELNEKEIFWIDYLNTTNRDIGYNLMTGGKSGLKSDETKKKIGEHTKQLWGQPEVANRMRAGLEKATKTWQDQCQEARILKTCPVCGKMFSVPPHQANRIYCSQQCAGQTNIRIAHQQAILLKREKTQIRHNIFKKIAIEWAVDNATIIKNCPFNKISTTLIPLQSLAKEYADISDWRSISIAICNSPSKKDLLKFLKNIVSENIC